MSANNYALDSSKLPVESKPLNVLPLAEVAKALEEGLSKNFKEAKVTVVPCPDLTQSPWTLASKGLGGNTRVLDIGGVPYLMPKVMKEKLYDMKDYPQMTGSSSGLVIGAGAGPWPYINRNAEMMPNLYVKEDRSIVQETRITRTHDEDGSYSTLKLPETETRNAVLGNLFISDGQPGEVLKIECSQRIGDKNFVTCMRECLSEKYPESFIGLGGVFSINSGKAKFHVMPDFSPCPINNTEDVNNWLKFYEVSAPLTVLSVLVSQDPGLDLRVEHSHGWGLDGAQGGHYHYDTTPDTVSYTGYYNIASTCYRIDRPVETHNFGRD